MIRATAIIISLALAGCASTQVMPPPRAETEAQFRRALCEGFQPLTFSASRDSPETIAEIRSHNAAWDAVCSTK